MTKDKVKKMNIKLKNKKGVLLKLSLLSVFITGCGTTPIAPTQPESGVIINYQTPTSNYRLNRIGSKRNAVPAVITDGTVTVKNIPFFIQGNDNTCGQASMTSILNFWGVKIDYQTVIDDTNSTNFATDLEKVQAYLINKGLQVVLHKNSSLELLKKLVDAGEPPIVLLDFGGLFKEHYVVVSGYNDTKETVLINDPRNGANIPMTQADFEEKWSNKSLGNLLIFGNKYDKPIFEITS